MRFFFRSRQFRIILCVFLAVAVVATVFAVAGSRMSPHADIAGAIAAPFRSAFSAVSDSISDIITAYRDGNRLMLENAELNSQINELRSELSDRDELLSQNEFYKQYLGIKEEHPDFKFTAATLISRDADDPYGSFIINKGSTSGIAAHDPVITDAGLVGYITEVGLITSKVVTVISPELTVGALSSRTQDSGIVSGNIELTDKGLTRFSNLSRSCTVAVGDYVVTSGEGIFPAGILIGSIESIGSDTYNTSIYADIKPFADVSKLRGVMIITEFDGQGGVDPAAAR